MGIQDPLVRLGGPVHTVAYFPRLIFLNTYNYLLIFFCKQDNLVGTVVIISLLIWIPISCLISWIDRQRAERDQKVHHSLIRVVVIQSCSTGAENFTNYVFCHPQFSGVIQNIENHCAILTPVCLCQLLSK